VQAAILATGTELTRGELVNGNAAWLSERLTGLGIDVIEHAAVPDDSARIANTLARFGREVKLVVCTGGLGPTSDDLTAQTVAQLLCVPLVRDAHTIERIRERYRKFRGLERERLDPSELPEMLQKQADVPEGAQVLDNDAGVAAGFAISIGSARCYFLPGVPREMTHLFERHLEPAIGLRIARTSAQVHIRVFGLGESQVAERLADLEVGGALHRPGISFGYRAHFPETEVKVLAKVPAAATAAATAAELEAKTLANAVAEQAWARLIPYAYGGREDSYPAHVGELLRSRGLKLALAESCTGGLTAKLLTDIPGSSDFFQLSVVTYADAAKRDLLGVSASLLERHGAVSSEVAAAMAEGVLMRGNAEPGAVLGADIGAAITGIAGPGGGSAEKPVGTVWFAVSRRNSTNGFTTRTERRNWPGDRESVRIWAAYCALQLIAQAASSGTSSGTS
jgi:nicotinamide-nucleotide amidase